LVNKVFREENCAIVRDWRLPKTLAYFYDDNPQSLRFIGGYLYSDLRSVKKHRILQVSQNNDNEYDK
jgi:hypothetical protein